MARIKRITAKEIPDSRGEYAVQATVELEDGNFSFASIPQGKSKSSFEAAYVTPSEAVQHIHTIISPALAGIDPEEQAHIDKTLIELDGTKNKGKLGANALLAVSLACARAGAQSQNIFLWQHIQRIAGSSINTKPRLLMNLVNGGLHAGNNLEFQEYLVIPKAGTLLESFEIGNTIYQALVRRFPDARLGDEGGIASDFADNQEPFRILQDIASEQGMENSIGFGLDAAASTLNKDAHNLESIYADYIHSFNIEYLEDPFSEQDFESFAAFLKREGAKTLVVGDDLIATNPTRMDMAHEHKSINSVIIKPNQIGTLTETLQAVQKARQYGWRVFISHRSGETEDDFIADLAWGLGADGIKAGAPGPKERLAKYRRLLNIEKREAHLLS